jgi:hypothetical protein
MNVSYSRSSVVRALRVYRRTGSVTKTILLLRVSACLCAEAWFISTPRIGLGMPQLVG